MIHYGLFDFAAPPMTGADWFLQAAQMCGLGPGFQHHAFEHFRGDDHKNLRVSLVRNPCDWLTMCFLEMRRGSVECNHMGPFASFRRESLWSFAFDYLNKDPGAVGRLFKRYHADTCLRVEDMPWAFTELMESLCVPRQLYNKVSGLKRPVVPVNIDPELRAQICRAEEETMDAYDYFG